MASTSTGITKDSWNVGTDASFREVMEAWLKVACLSDGTVTKYKPFWIRFSHFLVRRVPGGLREVESEENLVHLMDDFVEALKNEDLAYGSMRTCSSALRHVPQAYSKLRGSICSSQHRSPAVKNILRKSRREQVEKLDDGKVDIAEKYVRCLRKDERQAILEDLDPKHGMAFSLCFQSLMRGDTMRQCKLCRIALEHYEYSAPDKLPMLFFYSPTKVSEGQSRPHAVGRHVDVTLCALGATARYFVWKYDIIGDPWPDFKSPSRQWYKENLLYDVSFTGMNVAFKRTFAKVGVSLGKVTHMRKYGALHLQQLPYMDDLEIESLGYWSEERGKLNSNMQISYLSVNPKAILHAAEHCAPEMVHLPRQRVEPPSALLKSICPRIEESKAFILSRMHDPELKDTAALRVLEVLEFSRKCFLQDAAILLHFGVKSAAFEHPVFQHEEWPQFQRKVLATVAQFGEEAKRTIERNGERVEREKLLPHVAQQLTMANNQLSHLTSMMKDIRAGAELQPGITLANERRKTVGAPSTKEPPPPPVNTREFRSLEHLWALLTCPEESSPYCSYLEAEARGTSWRKDLPTSTRRRKFWSKIKRLHEWVCDVVEQGLRPSPKDALCYLDDFMEEKKIGLGTLLMWLEMKKVAMPMRTSGAPRAPRAI